MYVSGVCTYVRTCGTCLYAFVTKAYHIANVSHKACGATYTSLCSCVAQMHVAGRRCAACTPPDSQKKRLALLRCFIPRYPVRIMATAVVVAVHACARYENTHLTSVGAYNSYYTSTLLAVQCAPPRYEHSLV